jgi:hypothetical protein
MKNSIISAAVSLFVAFAATAAMAQQFPVKTRIDCKIKVNGHLNTVAIGIKNLGTEDAELLNLGRTEEEGPILQGANNREITSMNDQGGAMGVDERTISFAGDGDGCTYVTITLYKNTGYTRGWASEVGTEVPHWYTRDVRCTVRAIR